MERALRGACSCGRNRYVIEVPRSARHQAQVVFDNSNANLLGAVVPKKLTGDILRREKTGRLLASPFCAFLVVPLAWYTSATYAYLPDESHRSIRRTFMSGGAAASPAEEQQSQSQGQSGGDADAARRQFCGYCGTPLSLWHERTREDAERIAVTLGSLLDEDLEKVEGWGLLRVSGEEEDEGYDDEEGEEQAAEVVVVERVQPVRGVQHRGAPWFEEMVEDGRLGRIKRQRGGHTSRDGAVKVEWEVVEWSDDASEESGERGGTAVKRKLDEVVDETADVQMSS